MSKLQDSPILHTTFTACCGALGFAAIGDCIDMVYLFAVVGFVLGGCVGWYDKRSGDYSERRR